MKEYLCPITLNTTRICSDNLIDISIEVSRIVFTNMRPNAVILVNKDEVFDSIAASPLIHMPIDASFLYTNGNNLNGKTLNEIKRLCPKGYNGTQVFLVGNVSKIVSLELNNHGFKTHHVEGCNHYETASMIPKFRKDFKNVILVSGECFDESLCTPYWSAHHGDPILFTQRDRIPDCTLKAISEMKEVNIYIVGSTKTVSKEVKSCLGKLDNVKHVERIDGDTPYDIAINFAKYKDSKTGFGWNRNNRDGHVFSFGESSHPMKCIAGILFAHMGKHTPFLLIKQYTIPERVEKYIKSIKPTPPKDMPKPPFMHGFILGSIEDINYNTQLMMEKILSIDTEIMSMECLDNKIDGDCSMACSHHMACMGHEMNHNPMSCMGHKMNDNHMTCMEHEMDHNHMGCMKHEMTHDDNMAYIGHEMNHDHMPCMEHEMNHNHMGCMKHEMNHDHMPCMKHEMSHKMIKDCNMIDMCHEMKHSDNENAIYKMSLPNHIMNMNHEINHLDHKVNKEYDIDHLMHMMEMKHEMGYLDDKMCKECEMSNSDHMMHMKQEMKHPDYKMVKECDMNYLNHMMEKKEEMKHGEDKMVKECDMNCLDHIMEKKEEMKHGEGKMVKVCDMNCLDHMMEKKHEMKHGEDKMVKECDMNCLDHMIGKKYEMKPSENKESKEDTHKISEDNNSEYIFFDYTVVNIDEILN